MTRGICAVYFVRTTFTRFLRCGVLLDAQREVGVAWRGVAWRGASTRRRQSPRGRGWSLFTSLPPQTVPHPTLFFVVMGVL